MRNSGFGRTGVSRGLLGLLCLAMGCSGNGVRIGYGKAGRIAKDPTIPGKFDYGQCAAYSRALHARLAHAGIRSRIVTFDYDAVPEPNGLFNGSFALRSGKEVFGQGGRHAVVLYEDGGRTYAMDNTAWMPKRVRPGTDREMAQQIAGLGAAVSSAQEFSR